MEEDQSEKKFEENMAKKKKTGFEVTGIVRGEKKDEREGKEEQ